MTKARHLDETVRQRCKRCRKYKGFYGFNKQGHCPDCAKVLGENHDFWK